MGMSREHRLAALGASRLVRQYGSHYASRMTSSRADSNQPAGAPRALDGGTLEAIQQIIAEVMSERTRMAAADIRPEWAIEGPPLAMDSVGFLRMIIAIEKRFGVSVPDSECSVTAMPTVASIVTAVDRNLARCAGFR